MPGDGLDLLRVSQKNFQRVLRVVFQNVEYRLQINAGALHHHMRATFRLEPLAQFLQFTPDSAELPQTAGNFLPTSMPAHHSITAGIIGASSR